MSTTLMVAGNYLELVRKGRNMTRVDVLRRVSELSGMSIETSESQLVRIEKGEIDTRTSLAQYVITAISASADAYNWLVTNHNATLADSQRLASEALQGRVSDLAASASQLAEDSQARVAQILDQIRSDPAQMALLAGYGERLLEERAERQPARRRVRGNRRTP